MKSTFAIGLVVTALLLGAAGALCEAGDLTTDNLTVNDAMTMHGPLLVTTQAGSVPTNGVILYYGFDTNSAWVPDDSGNGITGTVHSATWTTNGVSGGGYSFQGPAATWIDTTVPAGTFDGAFSLSAWVYPTGTYSTWEQEILAQAYDEQGWRLFMRGNYYAARRVGFLGYQGNTEITSEDCYLALNTWAHVVFTWNADSDTGTVYINGAQTAQGGIGGDTIPSTTHLLVGAQYNNGGNAWLGCLDEVRVYERELSADEVVGLYLSSVATTQSVAHFKNGVLFVKPLGDLSMGSYTNAP